MLLPLLVATGTCSGSHTAHGGTWPHGVGLSRPAAGTRKGWVLRDPTGFQLSRSEDGMA